MSDADCTSGREPRSVAASLLFFLAYSQRSEIGRLPYFHTWCGLSANLQCMSEMCCTRLTQLAENTRHKNYSKNRHLRRIAQVFQAFIFASKACIDNRKKVFFKTAIAPPHVPTPHNMVNIGLLTAKIDWWVWSTPANFNGFRVFPFFAPTSLNRDQPNFARCLAVSWAGTPCIHFWAFVP